MNTLNMNALLARSDLLFALRDLCSIPVDRDDATLTCLAEEAAELLAAADLPVALRDAVRSACVGAVAVGPQGRAVDIATWDGAATGLDLHESAYVRRDRGAIMGDIAGFYNAFGMQTGGDSQRPDRLGAELEFLGLLHLLAVRAATEGRSEDLDTVLGAAGKFWADHLSSWCALPAARAGILPAPAWLRDSLAAVDQIMTALASANHWPAPSRNDDGEADAEAEASCAVACAAPN